MPVVLVRHSSNPEAPKCLSSSVSAPWFLTSARESHRHWGNIDPWSPSSVVPSALPQILLSFSGHLTFLLFKHLAFLLFSVLLSCLPEKIKKKKKKSSTFHDGLDYSRPIRTCTSIPPPPRSSPPYFLLIPSFSQNIATPLCSHASSSAPS